MGKQDAEVKVRMNTKQAQADLKGLNKVAAGTARQVGGRIRGGMGRVAGAIGLGAVAAGAVGSVKGGLISSAIDVFQGATGGVMSQFEEALFGDANLEALAAKQARASLPRRLLGSQTTEEGRRRVKDAALPGHLFRTGQNFKTLHGARIFAGDPKFGGPGSEVIDKAVRAVLSKDAPENSVKGFKKALKAVGNEMLKALDQIINGGRSGPRKSGGKK